MWNWTGCLYSVYYMCIWGNLNKGNGSGRPTSIINRSGHSTVELLEYVRIHVNLDDRTNRRPFNSFSENLLLLIFELHTSMSTWKSSMACMTLLVPHISLMLCMLSCAAPTSSVGMPSFADMIGPMVLPHGESLRTTKSCRKVDIFVQNQ